MTDIQMNAIDAQKAIVAIEKQLATLRAFAGLSASAQPAKTKKAKIAAAPTDGSVPEKTRELSPAIVKMNLERVAIFDELKAAWTERNAEYASLDAKALAAAIKSGECEAKPLYSAALQEHSRRQREGNPEKMAKYEAYRAKVEQTRSEKSETTSVASAPTEKKQRKPRSEESKAKAAANRAAKKLTKTEAAKPAAAKEEKVEIIAGSEDDEETFHEWGFEQKDYYKNGLQYVYKLITNKDGTKIFGDYAGRYDVLKRKIDDRVPEPPVEDDE